MKSVHRLESPRLVLVPSRNTLHSRKTYTPRSDHPKTIALTSVHCPERKLELIKISSGEGLGIAPDHSEQYQGLNKASKVESALLLSCSYTVEESTDPSP